MKIVSKGQMVEMSKKTTYEGYKGEIVQYNDSTGYYRIRVYLDPENRLIRNPYHIQYCRSSFKYYHGNNPYLNRNGANIR